MKINTPQTIDNTIASLKKQLAELEATKQTQEKAMRAEIARQEKLKAELEATTKFNGWKPTKKSIVEVIEMASESANLKFFKNLRYTSGIHDISDGTSLQFGDGWVIKCKYSHGGGEGDGSERYVVLSVTQNGANETFWYVPGYYESYNGSELELDCLYQVEPYQKTVTDYRKI
jgi:hypothetical protein